MTTISAKGGKGDYDDLTKQSQKANNSHIACHNQPVYIAIDHTLVNMTIRNSPSPIRNEIWAR